jgi:hypothetical protein
MEKAAGCDVDHLTPSSAEVKNAWRYTYALQYVFIK